MQRKMYTIISCAYQEIKDNHIEEPESFLETYEAIAVVKEPKKRKNSRRY